ncbi:MAG: response regulator [Magnetococcales bacterium]|nr:response regulator [Magnetococcales bacterium]
MRKPIILVVDDTPANIDVVRAVLGDAYRIQAAVSGAVALKIVGRGETDLILLDIMMPGMDGLEVCRRLKADPASRGIPVIFLTAMATDEDESRGLELGAVDYITKPISPPVLLARVRTQLTLREAHRVLEDQQARLEAAHHQTMTSIQYARRIQDSILPPPGMLERVFSGGHCLLWQPRDVVGGDVVWCKPWGAGHLVILGDCTGHGVPGAFMTLIANGALAAALAAVPPGDPAALIGHMHRTIQITLGQDSPEGDTDDGLELGVCFLPAEMDQLVFAGARLSLFRQEPDGPVTEIRGDPRPIGYRGQPADVGFTNHPLPLTPGLRFFMTSDGLIDQVGGPKGLGFGKKRFMRLLESLIRTPLPAAGQAVEEAFHTHRGAQPRRDDLTVLGFGG